jgi:hypothetical protein
MLCPEFKWLSLRAIGMPGTAAETAGQKYIQLYDIN